MGETPGFYVDPSSAKEVLFVLFKLFGFELDFEELDEQIKVTNERLALNPKFNQNMVEHGVNQPGEDLRYIG